MLTQGNVRVSLPWGVSADDVERFLAVLPDAVRTARPQQAGGVSVSVDADAAADMGPEAAVRAETRGPSWTSTPSASSARCR